MRSEGFDGIDSSTTLGFARDQSHPLFQQPSTALEPPGLYSNFSAGFPAAIQQHSLQFHTLSQSHILFALKCLPSCLAQASLSSVRSAPTAKFERHHAPSLNLQSVHVHIFTAFCLYISSTAELPHIANLHICCQACAICTAESSLGDMLDCSHSLLTFLCGSKGSSQQLI